MPAEATEEGAYGDSYEGGLRKVARVILLDPQDRILLLHGHEPDDPSDDWWFTPGGGLEGEDPNHAFELALVVPSAVLAAHVDGRVGGADRRQRAR